MATSLTQFGPLLKTLYSDGKDIVRLAYEREPFFAMVTKNENFGGDGKKVPVLRSNGNRASHTFSTSASLTGEASSVAFTVTRTGVFNNVDLDHETILAAKVAKDAGAIRDHVKQSTDQAIDCLAAKINTDLYRNKGGSVGQLSAAANLGYTTTLARPEDAVNFDVGDVLVFDSGDGTSGTVHAGTATVTAVDRDLGSLTFGSVLTGSITGIAAGDYIFKSGDFGTSFYGLDSWIPSTAPSSGDSHFGVDRSSDPQRLAGVRIDGYSGADIEDILIDGIAKMSRYGAKIDKVFCNPTQWAILAKNLQGQVRYGMVKSSDGVVSFNSLQVQSASGMVDVVPDHRCPVSKMYLLEMGTWVLGSAGKLPQVFDMDGTFNRNASADSYNMRLGGYAQLWCTAPGRNGVIHTLPSQ